MRVLIRYPTLMLLSVALLLGQLGCPHMPKPPSEEMRAQFGTIGIVSGRSNPKIQFHPEFAKGRLSGACIGAGMGTGVGALYGLSLIASDGCCIGEGCAVVAIVAAAIGGVIGGVTGSIKGAVDAVPKKEAQKIEVAAKKAFDGISIQKTLAASVLKDSLELPHYVFVLLEEDPTISTIFNFSPLKEKGIDTVLELNVKTGGFKEGKGKNPVIAFFTKVHTRLIRTMDGKQIYSREFEYESSKHNSADWLDSEGRLLREEIDNCFRELPRQIVEEIFGKKSF